VTDKPSLIKVSTLIGYGSPNRAGTHDVHGAALGKDETAATREHLQWNYPPFEIPDEAYKALSHVEQVCTGMKQAWSTRETPQSLPLGCVCVRMLCRLLWVHFNCARLFGRRAFRSTSPDVDSMLCAACRARRRRQSGARHSRSTRPSTQRRPRSSR